MKTRLRPYALLMVLYSLLWYACGEKKTGTMPVKHEAGKPAKTSSPEKAPAVADTPALEKKFMALGLVDIKQSIPGIITELRYSTPHNFMGRDLYGDLEKVYAHPELAKKLKRAQQYLQAHDSSLTLLVFDAVRPLSVQKIMWEEFDMPAWKKGKFLSNPAYGSVHNYGMAVDISLSTVGGKEINMGTPYDDTARLAYPSMESHFLATGGLTPQQVKYRQLLRSVMGKAGFFGIQTEWWHFNACTRDAAKAAYKLVE